MQDAIRNLEYIPIFPKDDFINLKMYYMLYYAY